MVASPPQGADRGSAPPLTLTHQHLPGVSVIAVGGAMDCTTSTRIAAYIGRILRRPSDQLVFDLTEVSFVDSHGLNVLLSCAADSHRHGGAVHLAAVPPTLARLLPLTAADADLPVHATVQDADLPVHATVQDAITAAYRP